METSTMPLVCTLTEYTVIQCARGQKTHVWVVNSICIVFLFVFIHLLSCLTSFATVAVLVLLIS